MEYTITLTEEDLIRTFIATYFLSSSKYCKVTGHDVFEYYSKYIEPFQGTLKDKMSKEQWDKVQKIIEDLDV